MTFLTSFFSAMGRTLLSPGVLRMLSPPFTILISAFAVPKLAKFFSRRKPKQNRDIDRASVNDRKSE